jgi:hypothetical protein
MLIFAKVVYICVYKRVVVHLKEKHEPTILNFDFLLVNNQYLRN